MIFSTKTMHASTRNQTIWRPYCHSEIVISFFYNISISTAVLTKTYLSFKPTLFGLIPLACFFAVYISSRHWWYRLMLWFKIKSTEVHVTELSALFQSNYEALLSLLYIFIFINQWKCLLWSHWTIDKIHQQNAPLLARKFTCGP